MSEAIPIAAFGSHAPVAEGVRLALLPEYEVVHTCLTAEAALSEFPASFAGRLEDAPASGLGTNSQKPVGERRKPLVLFFGADVPEDVSAKVEAAVKSEAPDAKFVSFVPGEIETAGAKGAPDFSVIGKLLKGKFDAALKE